MNRKTTILIVFFSIYTVYCVENTDARNPFKPILPEKKVEVTEKKPVTQTKPTPSRPKVVKQEKKKVIKPIKELELPDLSISGIIWNSDRPQAIINGEVFDVGDVIMDINIVNISKLGIEFEYNGETMVVQP